MRKPYVINISMGLLRILRWFTGAKLFICLHRANRIVSRLIEVKLRYASFSSFSACVCFLRVYLFLIKENYILGEKIFFLAVFLFNIENSIISREHKMEILLHKSFGQKYLAEAYANLAFASHRTNF